MVTKDWYNAALALVLAAAIVLVWQGSEVLPWHYSDMSFHLSTAQGFVRAGGPTTWSFWEAVPQGRPNNYPPLFQVLMAGLLKSGLTPDMVVRLVTTLVLGGGLAIFAWGLSRLFSARLALFAVLLLAAASRFMGYSAMLLPADLVLFLSPLALLALLKGRLIALFAILVVMFYLHLFLPYVVVGALLLWCYRYQRPLVRQLVLTTFLAWLTYLPWFWHVATSGWNYIKYLNQDFYLTIADSIIRIWSVNLFIWPLFVAGLWLLTRQRETKYDAYSFFVLLSLAFLPLAAVFPGRSLTSHALLLAAPVAALVLDKLADRPRGQWLAWAVLAIALYATPYLNLPPRPQLITYILSTPRLVTERSYKNDPVFKQGVATVAGLIRQNTKPHETIGTLLERFFNSSVLGTYQVQAANYFAARAGRPVVNLREPEVYQTSPQLNKARLLLTSRPLADINSLALAGWAAPTVLSLSELGQIFYLEAKVSLPGETIYLYLNKGEVVSEKTVTPFMTWPQVTLALFVLMVLAVFDAVGGVGRGRFSRRYFLACQPWRKVV